MKSSIFRPLRFLLSLLLRLAAAILAGILLLSLVFMIPAGWMEANVTESANILATEFSSDQLYTWCSSKLDTWTDSNMLLNAAYQDSELRPLDQVMYSNRYLNDGNPYRSIINQYVDHTGELYLDSYPRYWHGYLVWLKPALCLLNYREILTVNGILQTILLAAVLLLMVKKGLKDYLLPFLVSIGMLMPLVLARSMQYSSCYYLLLLGSIAVLALSEQLPSAEGRVFLYLGIGLAYFDFLTYPIAAIGIPAVFCFLLRRGPRFRDDFCRLFRICFCWCLGYGGMWASKWYLATWITGQDFVANAMGQMHYRTNSHLFEGYEVVPSHPILFTILKNTAVFLYTPVTLLLVGGALFLLTVYAARAARNRQHLGAIREVLVFVIIAFMPIVWYSVIVNHSLVHTPFTNKALVVSAFGGLCTCVRLAQASRSWQNCGEYN